MTQVQIMYSNLMSLLDGIVNNPGNAAFIDGLSQTDGNNLMDVMDILEGEIIEITKARDSLQLYPNYATIESALQSIVDGFPTYPLTRYFETKIIIAISKVISDQVLNLSSTTPIATSLFEVLELDSNVSLTQSFFLYENTNSIEQSVILFSLLDYANLESNIRNSSVSLKLLFSFLAHIGGSKLLNNGKYVLIKNGNAGKGKRVAGFLLLQIISAGQIIHTPKVYGNPVNNPWRNEIEVDHKYQQFLDTFNVISEYNSNPNILEKYLKLYQVIEDYMYKHALVLLEREKNGTVFSLRDFKRMNEKVSVSEKTVLKEFMQEALKLQLSPGMTFQRQFHIAWNGLIGLYPNINNVKSLIAELKLMDGDKHYNPNMAPAKISKFVSELIYSIRNAIVHNKTTEFHLTYRTLTNDLFILLERFLIPELEKLIFFLTVKPTSLMVWFQNPALSIWQDS